MWYGTLAPGREPLASGILADTSVRSHVAVYPTAIHCSLGWRPATQGPSRVQADRCEAEPLRSGRALRKRSFMQRVKLWNLPRGNPRLMYPADVAETRCIIMMQERSSVQNRNYPSRDLDSIQLYSSS